MFSERYLSSEWELEVKQGIWIYLRLELRTLVGFLSTRKERSSMIFSDEVEGIRVLEHATPYK